MEGTQGRGGKRPGSGRKTIGKGKAVGVTVNLPPEVLAQVDALADAEQKSRSSVMLEIIQKTLSKIPT